MGNVCPGSSKSRPINGFRNSVDESQAEAETEDLTQDNLNSQIDQLMKAMQKHNLKRLKDEIEHDIDTFILNNLLMCLQFTENFERDKEAAQQFKRDKESELNNNLAQGPLEGMILGERRCHLLHGMPFLLARNYIYRSPDNAGEEEYYGNYYVGADPKNTFMSEGILPLEYLMTWDNLEMYKSADWDMLREMTYSSAKGSPPTWRFCMEEPDSKNEVPRGYVRLRSVDVTADVRKPTLTDHEPGYDYTYAGRFSDKASEAAESEEGLSDYSGSEVDNEEFMNKIMSSKPYLHTTTSLPTTSVPSSSLERPDYSSAKLNGGFSRNGLRLTERRNSGILPTNYPRLGKPLSEQYKISVQAISEPIIPVVEVNEPSTPDQGPSTPFAYPLPSAHHLNPPINRKGRPLRQLQNANGNSSSSGYDTMDSVAMSRSSSMASEEIRCKWRQVELKQLFQYPSRNRGRADIDVEKQDPLSLNCFIPVKVELSSDEEDSDNESDFSDSDSDDPIKETQYDTRYYLNSTQFSSEYCSEFHRIGVKTGLPASAVSQSVVLGTTIRCAVEHNWEENDPYYVTHTFTPAVHSKSWPPNYYFWFNQRMFNRKQNSDFADRWPSAEQVEQIEKLGSNVVPLGFRSISFFNTQQSLEWHMNFLPAESLLLNSFKHAHWRTYIFACVMFRAFIAPLGPQGIGVEHIRNIIYFMCHEDFVGWNEEQPGVYLRAVITKLFDCLGKGKMPNFFIQSQDILKNIPEQNIRLVQAHLSKLRDNLVVYCIYAFRNLSCLRPVDKFYPMPNFQKLYNILTAPHEKDLLQINNPGLGFSGMNLPDEDDRQKSRAPRKQKSKNGLNTMNLLENEDIIEDDFRTLKLAKHVEKRDKVQDRLRRKRIEYERKMKEIAKEQKHRNGQPDDRIPMSERRKSIDLRQQPVIQEKFSTLRKVLVIEFFIKHFINMAKQSNEFRAYAQSAMYIMQVENLCEILLDGRYDLGQTTLDRETIEFYQKQCELLRELVGKEMREYILSRFSHLNFPTLTQHTQGVYGEWSKNRAFHNNWDFRKLPTPPGSHVDPEEFLKPKPNIPRKIEPTNKKLETPNIAKTLQSIQPTSTPSSPIPSEASSTKLARRAESIKFIDRPVAMKKSPSRQSIMLVDEFESTDL